MPGIASVQDSVSEELCRRVINPVSSQVQLGLNDDDTEASSTMFNILHYKSTRADLVGIDRLKRLAVMVNKYDCMRAMYYRAKCKILAMNDRKELCHLLWPACAFDKAQFCTNFTKLIVLLLPNGQHIFPVSEKYGPPKDIEIHLPKGTMCEYPIKSSSKWVRINSIVFKTLSTWLDMKINGRSSCKWEFLPVRSLRSTSRANTCLNKTKSSYHCDCLFIAMLMNAMSGQGLWLLTSAIHRLSVAMVCKELRACDFGPPYRMTKVRRGAECPFCIAPKIL